MTQPLLFSLEDFFKDDLLVKLADHKLPRDVNKWEEAILGVLYNTHPWFDEQSLDFDLTKVDADSGDAVGAIVVDKKLSVPLIINSFKLKPLDLYIHNGKIRPFSQNSFLKDTIAKSIGKTVSPGKGIIGLKPLFNKVYPPYTGMQSFADFVDRDAVRKLIHDSFTDQQISLAFKKDTPFKEVLASHLKSKAKEASLTELDDSDMWELIRLDIGSGDKARVSYIHTETEKIACVIGRGMIDPAMGVADNVTFGVETNNDRPRYFVSENEKSIAYEPILEEDEHSLCKDASGGGVAYEAYIVPVKNEAVFIGPFTSVYKKANGVEKVSTFTGGVELLESPELKDPFRKVAGLFILGKGAVRVTLGNKINPLSVKEANNIKSASFDNLESSDIVSLNPRPVGKAFTSVNYEGMTYYDFDKLMAEMEKSASFDEGTRINVMGRLRKRKQVHLRRKEKQCEKLAAIALDVVRDIIPTNRKEIIRAAAFIQTVPEKYFGRVHEAISGYPSDITKIAAANKEKVRNTVDAVLSLNVITPETIGKYVEKLDILEEAEEVCAHLLLLARLGFPIEEQPVKTALTALEKVVRKLSMLKNTKEDDIRAVTQ